jgi:uncharacterized protein
VTAYPEHGHTMLKPIFETLDRNACERILERNHVGRIAYARANRIDIEPVHYVYADGWIYGGTSEGTKMDMTGYNWWPVVFEVDEVEDLFSWRSVVVHGGFYAIHEKDAEARAEEWRRGIGMVRRLIPEAFSGDDPVGTRKVLFRIAVQEISGRAATPG